jgi:hypothetical protein
MENLPCALREDMTVAARAEIIECPHQAEALTSATSFSEQCFHACRIVREERTPHVTLKPIGQVFIVERGTIYNHWHECKARGNEIEHAGRPPDLSSREPDEIIADIFHAFQQRCPFTLPEIASILQNKIQKSLVPDTFYHALTRDPSRAADNNQRTLQTVPGEEIRCYFAPLFSTVSGAPAHFIFNGDDMGSPWTGRRARDGLFRSSRL